MNSKSRDKISRLLSLVLRHEPRKIGITLDSAGWVSVDELLAGLNRHGHAISRPLLEEVVSHNEKKRFAFSPDHTRIRANQGHSVEIDLQLESIEPPAALWHGTVDRFLPSIRSEGLKKQQRHHVHLSADQQTATVVGERRGVPKLLKIASGRMHADGYVFYRSANGVWLTDEVPPQYIEVPD